MHKTTTSLLSEVCCCLSSWSLVATAMWSYPRPRRSPGNTQGSLHTALSEPLAFPLTVCSEWVTTISGLVDCCKLSGLASVSPGGVYLPSLVTRAPKVRINSCVPGQKERLPLFQEIGLVLCLHRGWKRSRSLWAMLSEKEEST